MANFGHKLFLMVTYFQVVTLYLILVSFPEYQAPKICFPADLLVSALFFVLLEVAQFLEIQYCKVAIKKVCKVFEPVFIIVRINLPSHDLPYNSKS